MAFDPSVIASIPNLAGSPVESYERGLSLKGMLNQQELQGLQLDTAKREAKEQSEFDQMLKSSDYSTPKGLAETVAKGNRISPRLSMELQRTGMGVMQGKVQLEIDQLTLADKRQELIVGAIDPIVAQARAMKNQGASDLDVKAFITAQMPQALQQLRSMQLADGAPALPDDQLKMATEVPGGYTLQTLESWESRSKAGQAAIRQRLEQVKADTAAKGEQTREAGETEKERHDRAMEAKGTGSGGKPPAGFEWDPDHPDQLRAIKGGPKDPDARPWQGREKIFAERIITSANQASRAISNITELPISASSGVFGVGGGKDHGIFASGADALRNEAAPQEVQDYNTMLAGVRRNLATIESVGLAPSGSLTEGFAALELRAGDSNYTKLRKLAEMRQVVDAGLEVQIADPAIPETIKKVAQNVIDSVHKAVPYTQADVTKLQRAQKSHPEMTLEELINKKGLVEKQEASQGAGGSAPPKITSKADFDKLPSGAHFIAPDGVERVKP